MLFGLLLWLFLVPALVTQYALWRAGLAPPELSGLPGPLVVLIWVVGIVGGLALIAVSLGWHLLRGFGRGRCPTCQGATRGLSAVGSTCAHCGSPLAEWMTVGAPGFPATTLGVD